MDSDPSQVRLMFELIREEWLAIPSQRRPWGIWITQHAPLPSDTHNLPHQTRTLQRAWLLQDNIFPPEPRDPWEYARFFIMQIARPWDPYYLASIDPRFHRAFELGMAAFAPFIDSEDFYLETVWGGLHGWGRRIRKTAPEALTAVEFLWIS